MFAPILSLNWGCCSGLEYFKNKGASLIENVELLVMPPTLFLHDCLLSFPHIEGAYACDFDSSVDLVIDNS